ncbi:hypothetical protein PR003_g16646 [Phytophthora rubi]|uniref:GST N-terminal domain-containing protein n=1 Tax=Phytophthora rubi TaxID=129364 RepID=A0A6A3L1G9_9STRA|nr:hypothetical protein PR002_g17008 [Phytophthora rubi]KAE9011877.1 hypothetical protein PR001_g15797 [Phytophthora rubi]KAE9324781.1 hypothetical protein PR003_g16646 [Phytophthora rubi]
MPEELYASPISQPSRAVFWLCKANNHPIEYKYTDSGKGETRTETFLQLSPIGKIPVLKDGEFVLTECHAIMLYLADKHGWESWCPKDLKIRARIHEYTNWHHLNTRRSSEIFFNQLMVNIGRGTPAMEAMLQKKHKIIADMFRILEFWLRHGNLYLVSNTKPTVVDLSCYNEVVQLEVMGLLTDVEKDFPKVAAWLKRMKDVPHHDEMLAPMGKFFRKFKLAAHKL